MIALLYIRARSARVLLGLNELECVLTNEEITSWMVFSLTALASAIFAAVMPADIGRFAGFVYLILPIAMPAVAIRYEKQAKKIKEAVQTGGKPG